MQQLSPCIHWVAPPPADHSLQWQGARQKETCCKIVHPLLSRRPASRQSVSNWVAGEVKINMNVSFQP